MIITTMSDYESLFGIKAPGFIENTFGETFPGFCKKFGQIPNELDFRVIPTLLCLWVTHRKVDGE